MIQQFTSIAAFQRQRLFVNLEGSGGLALTATW